MRTQILQFIHGGQAHQQGGNGPCPLAPSRSHLHSRTLLHPDRLATLDMTICACLTDSYDSTHMLYVSVWQVCDTVCVVDQEHEDFHAEHPVAAAQGKAEG